MPRNRPTDLFLQGASLVFNHFVSVWREVVDDKKNRKQKQRIRTAIDNLKPWLSDNAEMQNTLTAHNLQMFMLINLYTCTDAFS